MTVGQAWDPSEYARNARFVSELGVDLVALLAPKPGERVLDLGCGDGALTKKLLEAGCSVVGVDSSPELVSAAQAYGVDAHVARAESLPYESEFDAVFSNAVLHWVPDLAAPIRSIHRALRPNGRFVAEMGGEGNIAGIRSAIYSALEHRSVSAAALDPWVFPSVAEYRRHLEASGLHIDLIELNERPTQLPGELSGWLETFAKPFLLVLPSDERRQFINEVTASARDRLWHDESWIVDYVRLRFVAHRRG